MRLLDTKTLELREFFMSDVPPYAILSHTWSDDEVTFQEMSSPTRSSKKGFDKIAKTCRLARWDGVDFAWVDTCCIDKSSSAELSEAINSMYQWYLNADYCYIYLEDLDPNLPTNARPEEWLPHCRWLTRGWTLQELLAPKIAKNVKFFDMDWRYRGTKLNLGDALSEYTGIPLSVLTGGIAPSRYSVASRMSWAARRRTTRLEDTAYCLLGLFDVNMPLLYGEGTKAFRRLQEEIIKRNNDLTIFAWEDPRPRDETAIVLFAASPAAFANSFKIAPFNDDCENFSVTNKGLLVSGDVPLRVISLTFTNSNFSVLRYALFVGTSSKEAKVTTGGISLRKIGPKLYVRDSTRLAGFSDANLRAIQLLSDMTEYYILTDPKSNISARSFRKCALHVPSNDAFQLLDAVPETLWDVTDQVFLKPKPYNWSAYPMVIAMHFRSLQLSMEFVVLAEYKENDVFPACKLFWKSQHQVIASMLFAHQRNRQESIYWSQFEIEAPYVCGFDNKVKTKVGGNVVGIKACFEKGVVPGIADSPEMFSLKLDAYGYSAA